MRMMRLMRLIKALVVLLPLLAGSARLLPLPTVIGQTGLSAPTGVIASDGSYNTKVGINWNTVLNATGYQIFRSTTNDAAAAVSLGTTVAGAFFDNTAVPGQSYFYWVRAVNGNTASSLSAPDQGTRAVGGNPNGPPPLNPPPEPAGNPVTATKAWLGKTLFWDEQLSSTRTVSCGTCHHASSGGSDPRSVTGDARALFAGVDGVSGNADDVIGSPGVPLNLANGTYQWSAVYGFNPQITGRRGMSAINAAYANSLFWDGRALPTYRDPLTNAVVLANGGALESQIAGPPVNPTEMAHTGRDWNDVAARVMASKPLALSPEVPAALTTWISSRSYPELFAEAFGTPDITPTRIALAIASYERTLYSDRTPADLNDLTQAEARGQQVFNQSRCDVCHRPILFTDDQFHNTGIRPAAEDPGLFVVTGNQNDQGKFRTPSLRNVELRAPYMHNGRFATLEAVVEFYNRGGDVNAPNLERNLIRPLNLSAQQKSDLVAFLKRPLTDPRVAAETAPFDRPMLYTESMRVPQIKGSGLAGSSGIVPQIVAIEPPIAGNTSFTVGVQNALGGVQSVLVIDQNDPGASAVPGSIPGNASFAILPVTLSGTGAGAGHGSLSLTIPNDPALIGKTLYGRWFVNDPAAAGGVSVTPAFQFTVFGTTTNSAPTIATVSAATFGMGTVAAESIVSGFGTNFSSGTEVAATVPLPQTLAGVNIAITDVLGVERLAPLFFVSPNQINYQIPAATATGEGSVTIRQGSATVAKGLLQIAGTAPGFFTANASGQGVPAALLLRVKADGVQNYEPVAQFDQTQNRLVALPIDLGPATDQLFLVGFGTGFRNRTSLAAVTCTIGGTNAEVLSASAQGSFVGLDQVNIAIPRSLAGRGNVDIILRVDGKTANTVAINVK